MRRFLGDRFRKSCGGAIMFQVLLGIGIMVLMSPVVFQQIKKYNEEIHREEVIADMEKLQKAGSSFVLFEKETSKIPEGIKLWSNGELKSVLGDYLGGSGFPASPNDFGQEYSLITMKSGNEIDGLVVASCLRNKCINDIVLNGIGQFLFDRGAIVASDGEVLSDLKLSDELKEVVQEIVRDTESGLLVMFISDAYFTSDYLHITEMPGESSKAVLFNTMLVDLDMAGGNTRHNVNDVNIVYGNDLTVRGTSNLGLVSVNDISLKSQSVVHGGVEYKRTDNIFMMNGDTVLGLTPENELYFNNAEFKGDLKLGSVDIDTLDLKLDGDINVSSYDVLGDALVTRNWADNMPVGGISYIIANMVVSNGSKVDNAENITMIDDTSSGTSDGFIYVGQYEETSSGEKTYEVQPAILNLAGTSEVKDICVGGECLSQSVLDTVVSLSKALNCYLGYTHGSELGHIGDINDCKE